MNRLALCIASILITMISFASQVSLLLENDVYLPDKSFGKGDHDYTNGTGFEYVDDSFMHYKF